MFSHLQEMEIMVNSFQEAQVIIIIIIIVITDHQIIMEIDKMVIMVIKILIISNKVDKVKIWIIDVTFEMAHEMCHKITFDQITDFQIPKM